ncbi:hypothetical protein Tco_1160497 [Tanacetum coccineum]
MANENVPAPAPTRSDDQILPFAAWVPIGKSNFVLDLQKKQKNLIFQISMDILQFTNFFRAFTASAFLDETRFVLDDNLLREALKITPIDQAHQFVSPPSSDAIMEFVTELGYTEEIHFVSRMTVNNLYQPWRAILSMINQCLTAMQTFLVDKANLSTAPQKGKKTKPHVIPYCQFTKLIICHLGRTHNIHQRSASPFHLAEEDHRLGNLKFVPKGEEDEKTAAEEGGKKKLATKADKSKKPATAKQLKPKPVKEKSSKPAPAPKPKVTQEKPSKPSPVKPPKRDEPTQPEPEPEPEHQGEGEEYDVERAIQMSLESFQAQGQAHVGGVAIREPVAEATRPLPVRRTPATEEASTRPSAQPQDDASANIVHDSSSPADAETGADTDKTNSGGDTEILQIGEEQGEDVANVVDQEEKTAEINEGQAGSDPGKTPESRPPPERVLMEEDQAGPDPGLSHVALAGPDPEPMHDDFVATVYPQVHESLKHPDEEHVHEENPLSSTGTLSSMKNLDAFNFGDQFFNDKLTEEDPGKTNMETKVESMVTVPIHQAPSSVPPLSIPKSKTLDKTTQNLGSRVFTLELRDLPHKINQTVNDVVKEAVHVAFQAPLRERFRELPEADMKEILHQRMFETGTYKSLLEHVALYEALEASMERANREGFFAEKDKSRKRRRDDQDPPPPPDSDLSKKKRHDSDASGSKQPPAPQFLAWKTSDTREAPSSSSKQ